MAQPLYICPADKKYFCSWEGSSNDIFEHFIDEHENLIINGNEFDIDLTNFTSENWLMFFNNEIYLVQTTLEENYLSLYLRYLGPPSISKLLQYDLRCLFNKQEFSSSNSNFISCDQTKWLVDLVALKKEQPEITMLSCIIVLESISEPDPIYENYSQNVPSKSLKKNISFLESDTISINTVTSSISSTSTSTPKRSLSFNIPRKHSEETGDNINFAFQINSFFNRFDSMRESRMSILPSNMFEEHTISKISCSNCFENMVPPIFLCLQDHNVCSMCKNDKCKKCYEVVTDKRNLELEAVSQSITHFCKYGCPQGLLYTEIKEHESKCNNYSFKCSISNCSFEDKYNSFKQHFKIVHPSVKVRFFTLDNPFPKNAEYIVMSDKIGIFYCKSIGSNNVITWEVLSFGLSSRIFIFELVFKVSNKIKDQRFLRVDPKNKNAYTLKLSKEDLKMMKVKDKNAVLNIKG